MKTSLVIAFVLVTGVAIEVAAYRINNNGNHQHETHKQWTSLEQTRDSNYGGSFDFDELNFHHSFDEPQNNNNRFNEYTKNDDSVYRRTTGHIQRDGGGEFYQSQQSDSTADNLSHLQYNNQNVQNQPIFDQPAAGLAMKIVEKIASLQKIAVDQNAAGHADYLNGALNINKNVVKMPKQQFVNFYNMTMKNLNNGVLEHLYVNPDKDITYVQYKFVRVETKGSFKSDVENAKRGYFTVVLNNVHSNVTTGFKDHQHAAVIRPAHFEYADVDFKTEDGAETRAFDDVLEHKFLTVLTDAVTGEVSRYTNDKGMVAQIKNEIRKPMVVASRSATNSGGKLFDLKWEQNNVAMEMSNVGYRNLERAAEKSLFAAMSIENQSENSYTTRYNFALKDLEWTSALNVVSAGNRMTARNVRCEIENIKIQVTVNKSLDQPQLCGKFNTNVQVTGLQYNLDNNSQSELVSAVENQFQRFIEKSLESYFQDNLRQRICYGRNY